MSNSTSEVAQYTVQTGPFKGISALPGEIVTKFDDSNGREYSNWDTHARTRHFLTVFSPLDRWRVTVSQESMGILMEDTSVVLSDGTFAQNPAWLFTATLLDKDNLPVGTATVVQLINCPMAIEIGQTRARSKLYQSLGLPSSPNVEDESTQKAPGAPTAPTSNRQSTPKVVPVVDVAPAASQPAQAPAAAAEEATSTPAEAPLPTQDATQEEEAGHDEETSEEATASETADHEIDPDPALPGVPVIPSTVPNATGSMTPAAAKAQSKANGAIPKGLLTQINIRAQKAKIEVPELHTLEQAQAFLAQLVNPAAKRDLASGGA